MYKRYKEKITFAPLYVHLFRFRIAHNLTKAKRFLQENPEPDNLNTVSGKLKYYRFQHGLMQKEVADFIGVDRTTYARYEENVLVSYPLDKLSKAAELFHVDVTDLLDDYNLYLYNGQCQQIKILRKELKITQSELASLMNIQLSRIKAWEQEKIRISKAMFDKLMLIQRKIEQLRCGKT